MVEHDQPEDDPLQEPPAHIGWGPPHPDDYRRERERWRAQDQADRRREREEQSELHGSWGGVHLAVKGSIVVLALLNLVTVAAVVYETAQLNTHLSTQDTYFTGKLERLAGDIQEFKGVFMTQHGSLQHEIEINRYYLREVNRVCIMTSEQRERLQRTLPASLKDLLMQELPKP